MTTQTRQYRTKCFREQVDKEWSEHFWKFIENNLDKPWNWGLLSWNPNITFDQVLAHPEKPWHWDGLSRNPRITLNNITNHPELPWDWKGLSGNFNITLEFILTNASN